MCLRMEWCCCACGTTEVVPGGLYLLEVHSVMVGQALGLRRPRRPPRFFEILDAFAPRTRYDYDQTPAPHLNVVGEPQFITFRLRESLPPNRSFPASSISSGEAFLEMDRLLDEARCGATFLRQPALARVVLDSIYRGAEIGHYQLHAWVIMPNYVHLLLTPQVSLSRLLGSMKAQPPDAPTCFCTGAASPLARRKLQPSRSKRRRVSARATVYPRQPGAGLSGAKPEEYELASAGPPARPPQAGGLPHQHRVPSEM